MNRIILVISILFSFNAFGADKPKTEFDKHGNIVTDIGAVKPSLTGLERWGKNGVTIFIQDYSKDDKTYPLKAIKTKVELRLLKEGIKVSDKYTGHTIIINAQPTRTGDRVDGYAVIIKAMRRMQFDALDNTGKLVTYRTVANSKDYGGNCGSKGLISFIDEQMDDLLLNYLKANPKKK